MTAPTVSQLLRSTVSLRHGGCKVVQGVDPAILLRRSCGPPVARSGALCSWSPSTCSAPWLASCIPPHLSGHAAVGGCPQRLSYRCFTVDCSGSGGISHKAAVSSASPTHENSSRAAPEDCAAGTTPRGTTGARQRSAPVTEDPFAAEDPQLDLQAHMISDARADTRHFMEQHTFHRPLESSVSVPAKSPGQLEAKLFQNEAIHTLPHPIWTPQSTSSVKITHFQPEGFTDRLAYISVRSLRTAFDIFSGYSLGRVDERGWLNRICFLETVAGVPGMVGAMIRHLNSLRRMERDYGWIHTLLEEAENERMHLMTALVLKKPTKLFRLGVLMTQGLFLSAFIVAYITSRRYAHRFVGYLEEEAVITYTKLLKEIDRGHLPLFENLPAPPVARDYWCLPDDAMFRDVILAIRADESHHREVNHTFADLQGNKPNPFPPGH